MTAYMIARTTITDRTKFENDFMPIIKQAMEEFDAKLIAQSDNPETIHGDATTIIGKIDHLAILEFEDIAVAHACAQSVEFKHAMEIAQTCMSDHYVRLVEGMPTPSKSESEPAHEQSEEVAAE